MHQNFTRTTRQALALLALAASLSGCPFQIEEEVGVTGDAGPAPECSTAEPCAEGYLCQDGLCVAEEPVECAVQCGTGYVCEDGACVIDPTVCLPGTVDLDGNPVNGCECVAAEETCDGLDNDCDGVVDNSTVDEDGDGALLCQDCNDTNPAINPFMVEVNNGVDDNCDGQVDEALVECTRNVDCAPEQICQNGLCVAEPCPEGFVDTDGNVANGCECQVSVEICDRLDNDCDGQVDEDEDRDGDGFGLCDGDCNDGDAQINPLADESCNGIDDNCDGQVDNDVVGDTDADGDGFTLCGGDCDDTNPAISPMGIEERNGVDDDCDTFIDEGLNGPCRVNADCAVNELCIQGLCVEPGCPDGTVDLDADPANGCECVVEVEWVDGVDNDCDGQVDEDDPCGGLACGANEVCVNGVCEAVVLCDTDNACPPNQVCAGGACIPLGAEICSNGLDDDMDGLIDEDCGVPCRANSDCGAGQVCIAALCQSDPTAERCNGIDDDQDGIIDEGCACTVDADCDVDAACVNGACVYLPSAELCNGLDDDQDGIVDEQTTCAAGQACINGACTAAESCATNNDCAAGQVCMNGVCQG